MFVNASRDEFSYLVPHLAWNLRSIMCAATEMLQTADQFEQDAEDAFAAEALLVQVAAHF